MLGLLADPAAVGAAGRVLNLFPGFLPVGFLQEGLDLLLRSLRFGVWLEGARQAQVYR